MILNRKVMLYWVLTLTDRPKAEENMEVLILSLLIEKSKVIFNTSFIHFDGFRFARRIGPYDYKFDDDNYKNNDS